MPAETNTLRKTIYIWDDTVTDAWFLETQLEWYDVPHPAQTVVLTPLKSIHRKQSVNPSMN
jgi:hypothetical protein